MGQLKPAHHDSEKEAIVQLGRENRVDSVVMTAAVLSNAFSSVSLKDEVAVEAMDSLPPEENERRLV